MAPSTRATKRSVADAGLDTIGSNSKQTKLTQFSISQSPNATAPTEQPNISDKHQLSSVKKAKGVRAAGSKKKDPANEFYNATIKVIDKTFKQLVKQYKPNPNGWYGITADDFSKAMASHATDVKKLINLGSLSLAFNLLMDLGEHAYGDLEACVKAAGFDDTDEPFQEMDKLLIEIITARRKEVEDQQTSEAPEEHTGADATATKKKVAQSKFILKPMNEDLGSEEKSLRDFMEIGHGRRRRPNKQQRGQLNRARLNDLKTLFEVRRQRRATTEDWAGNALNELVETRDRIGAYGIGCHFFTESIGLLATVKGVEVTLKYRDEV
ncbi:hypothetical protein F5Y16DRAFT_324576 [Xylariaceae sp. FL0255]|nr:hypothetical protein F5Y16DRAFT_324576 [Xylariaceae sp. FL0255]